MHEALTPLEFLERLALLIHPPRIHRHRYHGVLAPNAKLRYQVIALGREQGSVEGSLSGPCGSTNKLTERPRWRRYKPDNDAGRLFLVPPWDAIGIA